MGFLWLSFDCSAASDVCSPATAIVFVPWAVHTSIRIDGGPDGGDMVYLAYDSDGASALSRIARHAIHIVNRLGLNKFTMPGL